MKRLLCLPLIFVWAALTFRAVAAPEEQPPLELPVPPAVLKESHRRAYGVYTNGAKVGWSVESRSPGKTGKKNCITLDTHTNMEVTAMGRSIKATFQTMEYYDEAPPHRALVLEKIRTQSGQEQRFSLRLKDGMTYTAQITEAGKTRSVDDVTCDLRLTHRTSPEVWAADPQRKAGDTAGAVEFDFAGMKRNAQLLTILKEAEWTGPGGRLPVWETEIYVFARRMTVQTLVSRTDGSSVQTIAGSLMEMRLEPEAVAKQKPDKQPDFVLGRLVKSDRKLGPAANLTALEFEFAAGEGASAPALMETVNQSVAPGAGGALTVRITRGKGKPQPASPEDRADNLKSSTRYPAGMKEVTRLAAEAVGSARDDVQKVKNLLRFTDLYLKNSYEVEALTVMDLLKSRKGECSAHALLFTTLARAAGIPAREASGWLYMGDAYQAFGGHAWSEVILDGHWVPVDPSSQQFQLDAGHIQSHAGEVDGKALDKFRPGLRAKVISSAKEHE